MSPQRRKTEGTPLPGGSTSRMAAAPDPPPEEGRSTSAAIALWIRGALLDNAALKFVALVLALTVFILVHSDERAIAGATVRVNYILPEDRVLVSEPVKEVSVTVTGSRRRLKRFHESELEDIELDLRNMTGGEIFFQPSMIEGLPEGVELVSITPDRVKVELDEREVREIPVSVETVGAPGRGYRVESIEVTPSQVKASGAGSRLAAIDAIPTAALRLDGRTASFRAEVRLALPPGIEVVGPRVVQARVVLGEEQGSRQLELPVAIQPAQGVAPDQAARFHTRPERVRVVLRGSILAIDAVREEELSAYVRLFPDDVSRGGARRAEVRISPALPGIGYEVSPADVTLEPRP